MYNPIANDMISAARGCKGTPFHHQGRIPGVGLDCIGLIVIALRNAGIAVDDCCDYGWMPDSRQLLRALEAHDLKRVKERRKGDILLFRFRGEAQHAALATDTDTMIHAYAPAGSVVETSLGPVWQRRLCGVYRLQQEQ